MIHLNLPKVCERRGRHMMSKLSQDAPWLTVAENFARAAMYGERRYFHCQCRLCGKKRTVAIEEREPGARESKRLLSKPTHATLDPRQLGVPLKLRENGDAD